ncbi:hypothetical protein SCT_2601 [Sulfuricella sp. T08]|uniref:DUF2326 domain-containing protein n=1 Tax=Sulfuricella sp. T08 TaxID=1632857 RepID=UPI00061797AD|nr:DUF2326 domain-containing protein [Sulfuricella sp. T08]GAO37183.1 hypothetical protein SCT_2601 [Sulfuricella sp. T08]
MFLKSLTISSGYKVIREIVFHEGLNLIVDDTPADDTKQTGNNVGKTTVLALIDFCLGGSGKYVYTDPENKKEEHRLVKKYLNDHRILVSLVLKADLSLDDSEEVLIERNFLPRKDVIRRINGKDLTESDFERTLTDILSPGHFGKKPSFRQIISHNIRYKDLSINNTLKTLDGFTRDDEYETLYLFLFGCDVDHGDRKQELLTKIRLEQSFKDRLEKEETRSAYETALALLDGEIERLSKKKSRFNLNERLEADLSALNELKYEISVVSSAITKLEIRRKLIVEASDDLNARVAKVDHGQLRLIYQQARQGMEGIQKTFEELCVFHDRMLREKVAYVTKELPKLEETIRERSESLKLLIRQQSALTEKINHSDSFEALEKLMAELNEKYRKKGEYEKTIAQLREVDGNLATYNRELTTIDDQLFSDEFGDVVRGQVGKFNTFFSEISSTLYGEQYALKVDPVVNKKGQRLYKFSAFNTNFSSGKKQGEIFCFDIAYTLFADQEGIPCLHFLLNDKKELMHGNQLLNIANLVQEKGIQFVASILHDKLPPELDDEKYFAVKLSQADKVLRIESVQGT